MMQESADWQDCTSGAPAVAEGEEGPPQPPPTRCCRRAASGGAALPKFGAFFFPWKNCRAFCGASCRHLGLGSSRRRGDVDD